MKRSSVLFLVKHVIPEAKFSNKKSYYEKVYQAKLKYNTFITSEIKS